jgi:hypothetical protein
VLDSCEFARVDRLRQLALDEAHQPLFIFKRCPSLAMAWLAGAAAPTDCTLNEHLMNTRDFYVQYKASKLFKGRPSRVLRAYVKVPRQKSNNIDEKRMTTV